jgi:uncharacterized protein (DUF433 family)
MADNKDLKTQQDKIKVDLNDNNEVEYLHSQFPELEREQIVEAIKEKGPLRKNITEYLKTTYRV